MVPVMSEKRTGGRPPIPPQAAAAWALYRGKADLPKLATSLGVSRESVVMWKRVPAERVMAVADLLHIAPQDLRPDLYPVPDPWRQL